MEISQNKVYSLEGKPRTTSARPDIAVLKDGIFPWKTRPKISDYVDTASSMQEGTQSSGNVIIIFLPAPSYFFRQPMNC